MQSSKDNYHGSYDSSERRNHHRSDKNYDRRSYSRKKYDRSKYQYYKNDRRSNYNGYKHRNRDKPYSKVHVQRSPSPVEGTDEFMNRKVQQTSASIMRHILSGDNVPINHESQQSAIIQNNDISTTITKAHTIQVKPQKAKHKTARDNLSAKDIHIKIMNHITNLNKGKKQNFINSSNSTGLDDVIHHINLQKKLEISRILRDMNKATQINTDNNSIIPDLGIDLNQLPRDVIDELTQTLNIDLDYLKEELEPYDEIFESEETKVLLNYLEPENPAINFQPFNVEQNTNTELEPPHDMNVPGKTNFPINYPESLNPAVNVPPLNVEHNTDIIDQDVERIICTNGDQQEPCTQFVEPSCDIPEKNLQPECNVSNQISVEPLQSDDDLIEVVTSDEVNVVDLTDENDDVGFVGYPKNGTSIIKEEPIDVIEVLDSTVDVKKEVQHIEIMDCDKKLNYKENVNMQQLLETTMKAIEKDKQFDIADSNITIEKMQLIDDCMEQLFKYKNQLLFSRPKVKAAIEEIPILTFPYVKTQITAIVATETEITLSTKSGQILFVNKQNGNLIRTLVVSGGVVTSMIPVAVKDINYIFAGCVEKALVTCNLTQKSRSATFIGVVAPINCMVARWDYVFMGCKNGTLIRYSCAKEKVEYEEKNLGNDILVIKAMQEGPRKVLLMGHRQSPIYVRDAFSGLHLRSFSDIAITPTVYSIALNDGNLYCGTAKDNVLVFSFYEGSLMFKIVVADCVGISCMTIHQRMLFVGCYNGLIYIYDLDQKRLITSFRGPGGSIICMEVLKNQILVGTFTNFQSLSLPKECTAADNQNNGV